MVMMVTSHTLEVGSTTSWDEGGSQKNNIKKL